MFFSAKVFSQIDSLNKAGDIYTVSFVSAGNENLELGQITLYNLDNDYLSFTKLFDSGKNINPPTTKVYQVRLENISSFGYKVPTNFGGRILIGGLIGAGGGALLGYFATGLGAGAHGSKEGNMTSGIIVPGVIGGLAGVLFATITSSQAQDYESTNVSKLSRQKKYEVLKSLIKKGIIYNKDE